MEITKEVGKIKDFTQRNIMTKSRYGDAANAIRDIAATTKGVSLLEAAAAIGRPINVASVYIASMLRMGETVRAGVHRSYRYFKNPEHAAVYDVECKAAHALKLEASRIRRMESHARRERERRAVIKASKPEVIKKPKQTKSEERIRKILDKKPKCQNIVIETKQQHIDKLRAHQQATIVWPEHVKVQKVGGYVGDTRYKVDQTHVGSFSREWQALRA